MAGIRGLQGVVRKTVNDELQANIWDPQHMDKIVPSLLFNLQQEEGIERSVKHSLMQSQEKQTFYIVRLDTASKNTFSCTSQFGDFEFLWIFMKCFFSSLIKRKNPKILF